MSHEIIASENWIPIHWYGGLYEVSDTGNVRGVDRIIDRGRRWKGKPIKSKTQNGGHKMVRLCGDKQKFHLVHRLVLEAFVCPCPKGMECAHNNGNPSDNRLENLRWDTRKGNHSDKIKHGTMAHGERNAMSKLTEQNVLLILAMREQGALLSQIAGKFHITSANVSSIINRKTWKHVVVPSCQ